MTTKHIGNLKEFATDEQLQTIYNAIERTVPEHLKAAVAMKIRRTNIHRNDRAKLRAGMANWKLNKVEIAAALFEDGNEAFLEETFFHEIAHVIVGTVKGKNGGHGEEWQRLMRALGQEPRRTCEGQKAAVLSRNVEYKWTIECVKCGPVARRHVLKRSVIEKYRHRGCGGGLRAVKNF